MRLDRLDLNLLCVFDTVFEERNLLRAAKRLNLSHSAISHAIKRLRGTINDDLFVKTAAGMEPTPRAMALAGPVRQALQQISSALDGESFLPDSADCEFVIAASDYVTRVLMGAVSLDLAKRAPLCNVVIRPSTRIDLAGQIDLGRIHLAIGAFAELPARFRSMPLWTQTDHLVMRPGHPLSTRAVSTDDLQRFPLLAVSLGGAEEGAVDGYISERGLARQSEMFDRYSLCAALAPATPRLRMSVAHSLAMPALLIDSDMLGLLPAPLARIFAREHGLVTSPVPYASRSVQVCAVWHERSDAVRAHLWLRERIRHSNTVVNPDTAVCPEHSLPAPAIRVESVECAMLS
jgi:DNA-binding transcriptional LysR family regulator